MLWELADNSLREEGTIYYISFYSALIESIGYDPQCALLEIKLLNDGQVLQYKGVPEEVWYRLRETHHPDVYYRRHICGRFQEARIAGNALKPESN